MRLTNVARMGLPHGRLHSYGVRVEEVRGELPISFDQERHVALGERPGSWMGIALRLPSPTTLERLAEAWLAVVRRHGTLHSVFTTTPDGELTLHDVEVGAGEWTEHEVAAGRLTRDVLREVLDATCTPYASPSHRLCVVEPDDDRPAVVIGSDHAHVDMWSLLLLVRDLLAELADPTPGARPPASRGFEEHTAALAARPPAPDDVRRRWAEVLEASGGVMPCFPLPLGDVSVLRPEVVEVRDVLDSRQVARLVATGRDHGVRLLPMVVAAMTEVTAELADQPLRAVFPVHSRHDEGWHDSVGWFITNAVLESDDPEPAACAGAVKEAMSLGSWPLADVLAPYGGMPAAPGMFAISWLDLGRLPVATDPALAPQFVGSVIETDGVMLWFVLNESGLHLRCRHPDTEQARQSVGRWLDAVVARLGQMSS
ncbi:peptide synthetase [Nocardioides sp.]|uniref:peptide synthetase n=1 Tax=Nocardioides sp. TaxID=35761 RepID=UPI002B26B0F1|nr:peptide synthetase [Nocardioides sp.]